MFKYKMFEEPWKIPKVSTVLIQVLKCVVNPENNVTGIFLKVKEFIIPRNIHHIIKILLSLEISLNYYIVVEYATNSYT